MAGTAQQTTTHQDTTPRVDATSENAAKLEPYLRFWNAGPDDDRGRLAEAVFTDDVEYRAHIGVLEGRQALMDFREQFVSHMGGAEIRLREQPQLHHDRARLEWELLTGSDARTSFATGTDVIRIEEDGRISGVTVFLDRAPEGFGAAREHH
ncbi:nuclear transport factor 2 family protein [Streptomyces abyssomicinicus]|uniref:nuclear transport factor 2 family protein n=1 Tax=Streptomyces abyssomicinicus TaxID=574929 RepID=UPI001250CCCA|nr:nuclear transport factor 2 family protein [Streptomyces abyssomicinicus]